LVSGDAAGLERGAVDALEAGGAGGDEAEARHPGDLVAVRPLWPSVTTASMRPAALPRSRWTS
jgi:hypothetical protein